MPFFIDVLNHDHTSDRNNSVQSPLYLIMHIIIVAKAKVRNKGSTKPTNGVEYVYSLSSSFLHFT